MPGWVHVDEGGLLKSTSSLDAAVFFLYHILGSGTADANVNRREVMEYKVWGTDPVS